MLTEREIIRLHQLSKDGKKQSEIASILNCHPQTIYDHLNFRVRYPLRVYSKISGCPSFPCSSPMPIYSAAVYLPGWPSRDKTYRLFKCGILKTIAPPRKRVCLETNKRFIASAAKEMLPHDGVFISATTIRIVSAAVDPRHLDSGVRLRFWPSREIFYRMSEVNEVADSMDQPITFSAAVVYRINKVLDVCGVATI